ncbi:carboxypeptidase-like regulatory domain-containing protein [Mariniblastus sp.]|nr:carboxypeptidase-like regulatory domain-containing protein [Mariniblastus sp.]
MNRITPIARLGVLIAFLLILSGCGQGDGPLGYVSGKVTVANQGNSEGLLVRFMNGASGVGATAVVGEDGTYELKHKGKAGVPIGTYRVSITAYVPQMSDKEYTEFLNLPGKERKEIEDQRNSKMTLVPERFYLPTTSGLSYDVVSGSQKYDIDLTK